MAIDNLPSLLPRESSEDYAAQLLPSLLTLGAIGDGEWARAQRNSNATSRRSDPASSSWLKTPGEPQAGAEPPDAAYIRSSSSSVMSKPIASAPASRWSAKCGLPRR
jgi:hypothetical protein